MLAFARRAPRLTLFLAGVVLSAACFWFLSQWFTIFNGWFGLAITYDTRPPWLVTLMAAVTALPWLSLGTLVLLRRWRGPAYRPVAFAAGLSLPYLFTLSFLFLGPSLEDHWHRRPFDSQLWKANHAADPRWPDRLCMVDDLLGTMPLAGLSRDRIHELLGAGDGGHSWKNWDEAYLLGPERGMFRLDSETLVLRFGPDGRVSEYRILTD